MRFSEFKQYQPPQSNVYGFICEDDLLLEESYGVWQRIFGGGWGFEKYSGKEFEEISRSRLMDEALTPSLFTQNRVLVVTNAEKTVKNRIEDIRALQDVRVSSLRIVFAAASRKTADGWEKVFPTVEIDAVRPADAARWLVDRFKMSAEIARYLVDNIGTDLRQLRTEAEKLQTYTGGGRAIEVRDVDVLILRAERFGPFELDDAILAGDLRKAVQVAGAMLEDGEEPLLVLFRITRVWRQLFTGKSLVGKRSAREVAAAAFAPAWKAAEFSAACKRFEWKQLAAGFRRLLDADRAFKTSTPDAEGYFGVMLYRMMNRDAAGPRPPGGR